MTVHILHHHPPKISRNKPVSMLTAYRRRKACGRLELMRQCFERSLENLARYHRLPILPDAEIPDPFCFLIPLATE